MRCLWATEEKCWMDRTAQRLLLHAYLQAPKALHVRASCTTCSEQSSKLHIRSHVSQSLSLLLQTTTLQLYGYATLHTWPENKEHCFWLSRGQAHLPEELFSLCELSEIYSISVANSVHVKLTKSTVYCCRLLLLEQNEAKGAVTALLSSSLLLEALLQSCYYWWETLSHTSGHQNSCIFLNRNSFEALPVKILQDECFSVLWGFRSGHFVGLEQSERSHEWFIIIYEKLN